MPSILSIREIKMTDIDKAREALIGITITAPIAKAIEALIDAKIAAAFERWEADALHESMHGEITASREAPENMHTLVDEMLPYPDPVVHARLLKIAKALHARDQIIADLRRGIDTWKDLACAFRQARDAVPAPGTRGMLRKEQEIADLTRERDAAKASTGEWRDAIAEAARLHAGAEKARAALDAAIICLRNRDQNEREAAVIEGGKIALALLTEALGPTPSEGGSKDAPIAASTAQPPPVTPSETASATSDEE